MSNTREAVIEVSAPGSVVTCGELMECEWKIEDGPTLYSHINTLLSYDAHDRAHEVVIY